MAVIPQWILCMVWKFTLCRKSLNDMIIVCIYVFHGGYPGSDCLCPTPPHSPPSWEMICRLRNNFCPPPPGICVCPHPLPTPAILKILSIDVCLLSITILKVGINYDKECVLRLGTYMYVDCWRRWVQVFVLSRNIIAMRYGHAWPIECPEKEVLNFEKQGIRHFKLWAYRHARWNLPLSLDTHAHILYVHSTLINNSYYGNYYANYYW